MYPEVAAALGSVDVAALLEINFPSSEESTSQVAGASSLSGLRAGPDHFG